MIKKIIIILSLSIGLSSLAALAQQPPPLASVSVSAEVDFSATSGLFTYRYTVTNPLTNTGQIGIINIDISQPAGGMQLSAEGLVNGPGYFEYTSKAILADSRTVPMIPVGMQFPPGGSGGLSVDGTAGWGNDDGFRMLPGQSVTGYQITSRGLPAIRAFSVDPRIDYDYFPVPLPQTDDDLEKYETDAFAYKKSLTVKGVTIGLTAPPANFVALTLIDYLIDLLSQTKIQNWIKQPGIISV